MSNEVQLRSNPFARERGSGSIEVSTPMPSREPESHAEPHSTRPARVLADELRAMTGHEEQLIEELLAPLDGEPDTTAVCNELLARCLVAPAADPRPARARIAALTVAERDLALIALRRRSFGDRVDMVVECPACAATNEVDFDLGQLALELEPIAERICVSLDGIGEAVLRVPTAGDQAELMASDITTLARRRSWMLARVLVELGERGAPFSLDDVHGLPSRARRELEDALTAALPRLELGMDVRCHACTHEFAAPFEIESFFLPS